MWRPQNYCAGRTYGWVTMRQALERSLNLVTVRVAQEVGMDAVADAARRFGVIDNMPRYLAMSLGAGETTVMRMAAGYAGLRQWRGLEPADADRFRAGPSRPGGLARRPPRCEGCRPASPDGGPPTLVNPPEPAPAEGAQPDRQRHQATDPISAYQMVSLLRGVVRARHRHPRRAPG